MKQNNIKLVKNFLTDYQNRLCSFIEQEDGSQLFTEDTWQHESGGGGVTRQLSHGQVIEKAGVNFSHVHGAALPTAATTKRPELADVPFQALGVSAIIHPLNPYVPTTHANVRFIALENNIWWFGGGFDLTPYYGCVEDCVHWHQTAKQACAPFGNDIYPRYKKWCDDYFYLKHRKEPRGIGGLFFDDLNEWGFERCFAFMQSIAEHFMLAYRPILAARKQCAFGEREKQFQHYRRGRYVEFNLLYDRGTLFGLQSGGRTESILISLPPEVSWRYDYVPEKGSREEELYARFLVIKEWI